MGEVAMADQNERAFQKQPTLSLNRKGGLKPGEARFMCNPGLGFKTPAEARTGNYIDKKCPFTGKVSIRGRILTGAVFKLKMNRTAVIRRDYLHYVKKYNRFEKRHKNISVHLPPCFRDTAVGDGRPLSKTVKYNTLKVSKSARSKKAFSKF